ncbi:MAG TPA: helix-turn-helix domain-containing protein, partial [Candidatus Acidoferrum sp.]|nr:helix-turn-helix domain-containing protein [Candidatus Acidoferrum sp.]
MNHIDLNPLIGLGLTNLEAEIYAFLLAHSPATGYGIAKGIAKPTANTYKALESLQSKGAIIIDDSQTRLCRAVPMEELFGIFQRKFDSFKSEARSELAKIERAPDDSRIYQLQSMDQVISRFRGMFAKARRKIVLDFFPLPAMELRRDILAASERGVSILMKLYLSMDLPGVETVVTNNGPQMVERWPGQWANGVFDGEEYLLAFLSRDGRQVHQAVWSNNQYLSWIYY